MCIDDILARSIFNTFKTNRVQFGSLKQLSRPFLKGFTAVMIK